MPPGPPDRGPAGRFAFSYRRRLLHKTQFDQAYKRGRRCHQQLFQAVVAPNDVGFARLGMSIAARAVRTAVGRNRLRRLIREIFRHRQDLPAVDIIVSARPVAARAGNVEVRAGLEQLLDVVRERCARHSSS